MSVRPFARFCDLYADPITRFRSKLPPPYFLVLTGTAFGFAYDGSTGAGDVADRDIEKKDVLRFEKPLDDFSKASVGTVATDSSSAGKAGCLAKESGGGVGVKCDWPYSR